MRTEELLRLRSDLNGFLKTFDDCAGRPTRQHVATYVRGQLGPLQRKSVEPIALDAGMPPRTLQELLALHCWDEDLMRTQLQQRIARSHSGRRVIGLIDETSCPKKGDKTPGVQRQYCGATGKVDNCVVTVHFGLTDADFHALLDGELYLPEGWAEDRARCDAAKIPPTMTYRPKTEIALELIDRSVSNAVEFGWLTFDEGYGGKPPFLQALQQRGHRYVGEVPKTFRGWVYRPELLQGRRSRQAGRPRRFPRLADSAAPAQPVEQLAAMIDMRSKQTFHVKDTHKGPEVWHVGCLPFFPQFDGRPGSVHWLIVAIPALGGDPKYFVSNAASGVPLEAIVHVAFSRWHVERCFEDTKGEIGMDHFEVRNYRSLKRHLILSAVTFLFLAETNERLRGGKSGVDGLPSPDRDRGAA